MTFGRKAASRWARLVGIVSAVVLVTKCTSELPTGVPQKPSLVVRDNGGCVPEVTTSSSPVADTIFTTFTVADTGCIPNLAQWGIEMMDPLGVDTPQGQTYWRLSNNATEFANMPSPAHIAGGGFYSPPQVFIEFDPPVNSVEFYYSRFKQQRAIWNGQIVDADSMLVLARSRIPGTELYQDHDRKVLYANVQSTSRPFNRFDPVKLQASGNSIQWLDFRGSIVIDNLKVTRVFTVSVDCTPTPVIRTGTVTCAATWSPNTIPAGDISFAWHFQGDSVRVFPASNALAYDPPPPIDTVGQGMRTWAGPGVLGGYVSVQATWQNKAAKDSVYMVVQSRSDPLFGNLPVTFASAMADIRTDSTQTLANQPNPDGTGTPGAAGQNYDTQTNNGNISNVIHGSPTVGRIATGPNRGLWYVTSPGVQSTRGARVRTWLSGREQPKFSYSLSSGLLTNRGLLNARRKTLKSKQAMHPDSVVFLNGVWAHETYGTGSAKGHEGQIELAATSLPSCGKVPAILERVVASDSFFAMRVSVVDVMPEGMKSLYAAAGHNFVYGNHPDAPFYEVVSQTTVADNLSWKTAGGDLQQPVDSSVAPDPRWNCSRVY